MLPVSCKLSIWILCWNIKSLQPAMLSICKQNENFNEGQWAKMLIFLSMKSLENFIWTTSVSIEQLLNNSCNYYSDNLWTVVDYLLDVCFAASASALYGDCVKSVLEKDLTNSMKLNFQYVSTCMNFHFTLLKTSSSRMRAGIGSSSRKRCSIQGGSARRIASIITLTT